MSTTASADFICSKCKKGYAWYADFAGKVARCTCGAVIQFPYTDPKPKDPLAIPFLPRDIENTNRGPAPMELPKEDLDPKILEERRKLGEYFDDVPVPIDPVRDVHGPFALLAIGFLLLGWHIMDVTEASQYSGYATVRAFRFVLGVEILFSLLTLLFVGKLMGLSLGKWKVASYKLSAVYLAPRVISGMINMGMGDDAIGWVVGTGAAVLLYWGFFVFIFRLKTWQTFVLVGCIALVSFGANLLGNSLMSAKYGHGMPTF
jgi:hypothetical protein